MEKTDISMDINPLVSDGEICNLKSVTRVPDALYSTLTSGNVISARKEKPQLLASPVRKVRVEIHSRISQLN